MLLRYETTVYNHSNTATALLPQKSILTYSAWHMQIRMLVQIFPSPIIWRGNHYTLFLRGK